MNSFRILKDLDSVTRLVLVYVDDKNEVHIAHSFYYGGRESNNYLIFLYKDSLPQGMSFIEGWNYLDENSTDIVTVPVADHVTAVSDFLQVFKPSLNWTDLTYYEVKDFAELDREFKTIKNNLGKQTVLAFTLD